MPSARTSCRAECPASPCPATSKTSTPNPQSQSFSRSYGSILPTSLTYIVLSTRGCSPWRPDAVMSTTGCEVNPAPPDFHGPSRAHRTRAKVRCFSSTHTLSPVNPIPRPAMLLKRKENSSQGSRRRLQVRLRCHRQPASGSGILTRFPFDSGAANAPFQRITLSLRIDSPMSNCCSHGTFLHFSLQSSHLNICYYHQDLH